MNEEVLERQDRRRSKEICCCCCCYCFSFGFGFFSFICLLAYFVLFSLGGTEGVRREYGGTER